MLSLYKITLLCKMFNTTSAFIFFVGTVAIVGLVMFKKPRFREGFATIALDDAMPRCFTRDADAQALMANFQGLKTVSPNSNAAMAYEELKLILTKVLCIDADVTGMGMGPYSTYGLAYANSHDIEPAASFVSRCIKGAVRSRDIEVAMATFYNRGITLLGKMCYDEKTRKWAHDKFHTIITRATRNVSDICAKQKATLDRPAGPRDPGFSQPRTSLEQGPYSIKGEFQYF